MRAVRTSLPRGLRPETLSPASDSVGEAVGVEMKAASACLEAMACSKQEVQDGEGRQGEAKARAAEPECKQAGMEVGMRPGHGNLLGLSLSSQSLTAQGVLCVGRGPQRRAEL